MIVDVGKRFACTAGLAALLASGAIAVPAYAADASVAPEAECQLCDGNDGVSSGAVAQDATLAGALETDEARLGEPASATADDFDGAELQGIRKNTFTMASAGNYRQSEARRVLGLVNQARAKVGAAPLAWDEGLEHVAFHRAMEISLLFDHTRPSGQSCFTAAQELGVSTGYAMGENIAAGYRSAEAVNTGWTNSPGHYSNMISGNFTSIGISCVEVNGTMYWVEFFGATRGTGMVTQPQDGQYAVTMECLPNFLPAAFADINPKDWYLKDPTLFLYTLNNGLMSGYSGQGKFGPYDSITRGQVATILYRIAGEPTASSPDFSDVNYNEYYGRAIRWARSVGVISGYANSNNFGPNDPVTREQLALMLSNYASKIAGLDVSSSMGKASALSDWNTVSSWAREAVGWAVDKGLISGKEINGVRYLTPHDGAWRASMATIVATFHRDILKL